MPVQLTSRAPTLTSLPPECLLAIVFHLPPSSYAPLVQTSHHFQRFFSFHAATICNTRILTHYRASAFDLHSKYVDGWLVPSHPAVGVQQLLNPPNALSLPQGGAMRQLLLSEPGPQYLRFLIEYDFEIQTRRRMADRANADQLDDIKALTAHEKNTEDERLEVIDEENQEEMSARESGEEIFGYMVGTYAVRPFLRKLDDFVRELEERRFEEARRRWDEGLDQPHGCGISFRFRKGRKEAQAKMKILRGSFGTKLYSLCSRMKKSKRELWFGEIEPSESLPQQNKLKKILGRRGGLNGWLLWYYGEAGVLAFREKEELAQIEDEKREESQEQMERLAGQAGQRGMRVDRVKCRVKSSLRKTMKLVACFGKMRNFESLD